MAPSLLFEEKQIILNLLSLEHDIVSTQILALTYRGIL